MLHASSARWPRRLIIGLLALMAAIPLPLAAVQPAAPSAALPVPPPTNPGDENWSAEFRYPGLNGTVEAILAAPNGDIYAGGTFTQADDTPAAGVARWDGTSWHALGDGLRGASGFNVKALALGPDGSLYVGGTFRKAGGISVNHIARWDGTSWHALGTGVTTPTYDESVKAIAVDSQGVVYATGRFTQAGGVSANYIARWDGTAWHALGGGLSSEGTDLVIGPDGSVYASRIFTLADLNNPSASFVARWDGAAWYNLDIGPGNAPFVDIDHLAVDQAGMLYAAGSFSNRATSAPQNIARWDGSQWHNLGAGLEYAVTALAASPNGMIDVGTADGRISRWDGIAWTQLAGQLDTLIYDLATAADGALYVAIAINTQADRPMYLARWDGAAWDELSELTGEFVGLGGREVYEILAAPDGEIYVAGNFWHAGAVKLHNIARWDGAAWHALGSNLQGWAFALALGPDGTLYAGGDLALNGGIFAQQVARWDGTAWQPLGGKITDRNLGAIHALAVAADGAVYAGGRLTGVGGGNIARWDGAAWQPLGAGLGDAMSSSVEDLDIAADGSLYAAGHFAAVDGADVQASVARWDGSDWQAVDAVTNQPTWPTALALEFHAGSLYAVGQAFTSTNFGAGVVRWDGSQWQPIASSGLQGTPAALFSLVFDQAGNLYVGGLFDQIGSQPARNIARWDGSQWHALGSGVSDAVYALAVTSRGRLFAGGRFSMAGSVGSGRIAQWTAGDGSCALTPDVPAVFYAHNQPVTVTVRTPGTLACLSIQRVDASYPHAPAALRTGAYWAIHGTDQAGAPAAGAVFDLSLPRPAGSGNDDLACWLGITWNCAADSRTPEAVTVAGASAFGIWARAEEAVPGATWELSALAVDTSALTGTQTLTYTLAVGTDVGGHYTATLELHPALILLAAPELTVAGRTLSAVGVVSPGQLRSYAITVAVSPSFSGTITQTALVSGGALDRTLSAPPVVIEPAPEPTFRLYLPAIRR